MVGKKICLYLWETLVTVLLPASKTERKIPFYWTAVQQRGIPQLAMGSNAVSELCQLKARDWVGWHPTFASIRSPTAGAGSAKKQQSRTRCHAAVGQPTLCDWPHCYRHPVSNGRTNVPGAATVARPNQDGRGSLIPRPSLLLRHPLNTRHVSIFAHPTIKQPTLCQDLHCVSESSHKDIGFLPSFTDKYRLHTACCI